MRRAPEWTDAAKWAANQIEGSLDDPQDLFDGLFDPSAFIRAEPEDEQHTTIVVASREQPQPLRNRLLSALEKSSLVVVVGGPVFDDVSLSDVIEWVAGRATPLEFTHESDWWGLSLVGPHEYQASWTRIASALERTLGEQSAELNKATSEIQQLQRSRNDAVDELKAVSRELAIALNENSLLLARLERFEGLEEELAEAQRKLEDLSLKLQDLSLKLEETQEEAHLTQRAQKAAESRIRDLQARTKKLNRDRDVLKHHLALEKWKLQSMRNRRWWRIGSLIASLMRQPFKLTGHFQSLRQIVKPPPMPQQPAAAPEPQAADPTESTTTVAAKRRSGRQQRPVTATDFEPAPPPGRLAELRVAAILDDMSRACFAPECELVTFTPADWQEVLSSNPPHVLLVESAWKGNNGSWEYKVGSYSYPDSIGLPDLTALIDWCRARGIPTVFWNKEDPVHFEKFKEAAQLFDVVFTTDVDRAAAYRQLPRLENRIVAPLPFAAQPRLHYPGPFAGRDSRPVFAGTFYRNRHPERIGQMEMLLDAALEHDLVIYDRMGGAVSDSFGYPDRFQGNIVGSVPYPQMVEVYRRHRVFLNVNSVVESPTMMSRRVFELLACGTPVVSTPARGIAEIFGDAVMTVSSPEESLQAIARLLQDDSHWLTVSRRGVLAVAKRHLYRDRLTQVASAAAIELPPDSETSGSPQSEIVQTVHPSNGSTWERFGDAESAEKLDELAIVGRLIDCAAIALTTRNDEAYTYADTLPDSEFIVSKTAIENGFEPTPGSDAGAYGRVFLFPR